MKGQVVGDHVVTTIPRLHGESVHRYRILRWVNGPQRGYDEVEYEGLGLWRGPRCILYTETTKSETNNEEQPNLRGMERNATALRKSKRGMVR